MSLKDFHNRELWNVNEYLIKPELSELTSKQYAISQVTILNDIQKFYDDVLLFSPLSKFIKERFLNPACIQSDAIDAVYVYAHCQDNKMRQQKQKKFERTFSDPKFRFLPIFPNSSLREACNKNKIGWRLLITSDVFEIAEMFKDDISKREFLVPKYRAIEIPSNLSDLVLKNECAIRYYDPD